jgi:hypothetical protein
LTVDVLGQKIDVFVIHVLKIDVLEIAQMGRPGILIAQFKIFNDNQTK